MSIPQTQNRFILTESGALVNLSQVVMLYKKPSAITRTQDGPVLWRVSAQFPGIAILQFEWEEQFPHAHLTGDLTEGDADKLLTAIEQWIASDWSGNDSRDIIDPADMTIFPVKTWLTLCADSYPLPLSDAEGIASEGEPAQKGNLVDIHA